MDILAVIPHDIASQGYMRSQVINPLSYLSSLGLKVSLLCVYDEACEKSKGFTSELASSGIKGYFIKSSKMALMTYVRCAFKALDIIKKDSPKAIYAREVWGGLDCLYAQRRSACKPDFIYDFRGAVPEEIAYCEPGIRGYIKSRVFNKIEKIITGGATRLNAVTTELSKYLFEKYGKAADTVIPCCSERTASFSENEIHEIRRELGFRPEELVFIYSGGLGRWQMFTETVQLFSKVAQMEQSARLLVLSPDASAAVRLMKGKIHDDRYAVRSVPQKDVARYIAACDFGFLLRDDTIVNNVAFPIKFAEYAGAGLPVITTKGVREIARIVKKEGIGFIVDPYSPDIGALIEWSHSIKSNRAEVRKKTIDYCGRDLVWPRYKADFTRLYLNKNPMEHPFSEQR